ncbi:pyrroline-5-carboxylate reductase [Candidatus Aerophobetes bacterium]|uniref:Pyrroline-5-carboxylate reductase n=1 Tax=Aerophobetes bacterium TaxID=2030807 RepID=A0A2A4YKW8_UNCAE|nr:MAG: pyrroline-5-carboxylate reductase [Candidatus Aerophobetes bacterium]
MNIAIIGCGVMGSSLARNITNVKKMILCTRHVKCLSTLKTELKCEVTDDACYAYENADIVILAVKPKSLHTVAEELCRSASSKPKLILSILAGVTLETLKESFPNDKCVRIMPSLPLIVQRGVMAVSFDSDVNQSDKKHTSELLSGLGIIAIVPEKLFDPITVLASSGPGYICMFLEAMVDAGVHMGLKSREAKAYAIETMLGTAKLLQDEDLSLSELKHQVASPSGATIEALVSMEKSGVRSGIIHGMIAAFEKLS